MNHTQARQLIQAAADGMISEANRRALDRHLAGCHQCRAYSDNLNKLEAQLSQSLQARWQDVQPRRFSLEQARARAPRKDPPGLRRLYQIAAVPAFQFGALVALAVGLILVIGSAANSHKGTDGSPTPSPTKSLTEIAQVGSTDGACAAVANIDARVYRERDLNSGAIGALPHGQTAPVTAYYLDEVTNIVWLQITYNGASGWVTNTDAQLTGDCSQMPAAPAPSTEVTAAESTATPGLTATLPAPPPANTKPVCQIVAPSPQTMYADATLGASTVGSWPGGETASLLAWAHNGLPPTWFLIRYNGVTGWVWAPWYDPASGSPCTDLPLTAYPTVVPSPTADIEACTVSPSDYPASDHNVYTGPATTYPIMAVITTGSYVPATGIFSPPNYDTWVRVDISGQAGWMSGIYLMFKGNGCTPLTPVDFQPHPPTVTPTPTAQPDSTEPPNATEEPPQSFDMSVSGDLGTVQQFTAAFPWQGNRNPLHTLRITVTGIPPVDGNDGRRIVDYTMGCTGTGSSVLVWGWASGAGAYHCGDTLRSNGLLWSANSVQFLINAPVSGLDSVTYTVTVRVSAYPG